MTSKNSSVVGGSLVVIKHTGDGVLFEISDSLRYNEHNHENLTIIGTF